MKPLVAAFGLFVVGCLWAPAVWAQSLGSTNSRSSSTSSNGTNIIRGTTFGGINQSGVNQGGYPIGTSTSQSPVYYASPGLSPAPGVSSSTGVGMSPGQFFYYNNPGVGYYRPNPTASQFPAYPAPIDLGGGYYQLGGLTNRLGYWRAPSGYYYPWVPPIYASTVYTTSGAPAIYSIEQGILAQSQPSVGAILSDMRQFIEAAKEKSQLDRTNYENVFQRLNSITARSSELAAKNGGALNTQDETAMRKEIDLLSADLARALTP